MKSGLYSIIFALGLGFSLAITPASVKDMEKAAREKLAHNTLAAALPTSTQSLERSHVMEPVNPHELLDPDTLVLTLTAHRAGDASRDSLAHSTLRLKVLPNANQRTRPVPGHAVAVQASRQRSSSLPSDLISAQAAAAAVAANVKKQAAATIALVPSVQTTPVSTSRSVRPVGGYSMRQLNTNRVCCQCGACSCIMTCGGCECCHEYCVPVLTAQTVNTPSSASNPTKKLFTNVTASRD